jgi:hypothetical protein
MKVKTWHLGCLVVLVLAALYFLVKTREGLDTPPATPPATTATPPATTATPPATTATPPATTATPPVMDSTGTTPPISTSSSTPAPVPLPPAPAPVSAGAPSYNLTCTASPVSGMMGSIGMPETPAAWNVQQPPSGWNSKNGYTTTGN